MTLISLINNGIEDKQYFEFISVEFCKQLDNFSFEEFGACYYYLAFSGIHSKTLIEIAEKKIN